MFIPKENLIWVDGPFNKKNKCYLKYDQNVQIYLLLWKFLKREIKEISIVNKILQDTMNNIENVHQNSTRAYLFMNNAMSPCRYCLSCNYHYISV